MFPFPSWISGSRGCDKVVNGADVYKMASPATRPVVEIPYSADIDMQKRKRETSTEEPRGGNEGPRHAKRLKADEIDSLFPVESCVDGGVEQEKQIAADRSRISEIIGSQFSLDILMKHNELRLIKQELGKCQAALEQLRRCHLIPFPASLGTPESMLNVSEGTGPAIGQQDKIPRWAPPYGIVDGPYTRHYAKWLIPDPRFDGMQFEYQRGLDGSRAGKTVPEGRATRHSYAEGMNLGSKSRSQRGTASQKLQALSSGYPPVKDKVGPCILKRADGQMVKLVCPTCKRENFSSTQGFINHCRIAHRLEFKSHEEAASASGQPIEVDEAGDIVGEEKVSPAPNGLVHPLIRSAPPEKEAYIALLARIQESKDMYHQGLLPGFASIPSSADASPSKATPQPPPAKSFVPSSVTPHLSELLRSRGFGGNLQDIVADAKQTVDFDEISEDDFDEDMSPTTTEHPFGGLDGANSPPPMRVPARVGVAPAPFGRPGSSKGFDSRNSRQAGLSGISPRPSYTTPVINTTAAANHSKPSTRLVNHNGLDRPTDFGADLDMIDAPSMVDLSPNTVVSNNAPSLVSDDGEYDEGEDAESASSEDELEESDVAEIDIEDDGIDKVEPRTVMRNRSSSGSEGMRLRKEKKADQHVTFVSPVKDTGKEKRSRRS